MEEEEGGCDSEDPEEVGLRRSETRRKPSSDSDCSFSLFAIMTKRPGSQRVGFGGRSLAFLRAGEHRSRVALR